MSEQKVKLLKSVVLDKTPDPSSMELGQLAINANAENPFISTLTNEKTIVKFPSEKAVENLIEEKVSDEVEKVVEENYYTKDDTNVMLGKKSDTGHTHSIKDVTDYVAPYNKLEIDSKLAKKSDTGHTHSYNTLTNKPTIPTKVSELTNDAGYLTQHQSLDGYAKTSDVNAELAKKADTATTYTKTEVNNLINGISSLNMAVVDSLPTENISSTTIYLIKASKSETDNIYTEYLYVEGKWEIIGSTAADLSPYQKTADADEKYQPKGDYLTGYTESDPVFTSSPAHDITSQDIANWNKKSDFSGSYNDLEDKPTIPSIEGLETSEHASETYQPKGDYLTEESEPSFTASPAHDITDEDITNWNAKSDFDGDYESLTNKPEISSETISMVATLEDGSTKTYTLYGKEE